MMPPTEGARPAAVVTIPGLDAYSAYKLRVLARNARGSTASGVAGPFFTGAAAQSLAPEAPRVHAVSSFAVVIKWDAATSACRPGLRWEVQQRPAVQASSSSQNWDAAWITSVSRLSASSHELLGVDCQHGCEFRVRVQGVVSHEDLATEASSAVKTESLPPLTPGGARAHLTASPGSAPLDSVDLPGWLEHRFATVLGALPKESPVVVQEAVPAVGVDGEERLYITLDFAGSVPAPYAQKTMAAALAGLLKADPAGLQGKLKIGLDPQVASEQLLLADSILRKSQPPKWSTVAESGSPPSSAPAPHFLPFLPFSPSLPSPPEIARQLCKDFCDTHPSPWPQKCSSFVNCAGCAPCDMATDYSALSMGTVFGTLSKTLADASVNPNALLTPAALAAVACLLICLSRMLSRACASSRSGYSHLAASTAVVDGSAPAPPPPPPPPPPYRKLPPPSPSSSFALETGPFGATTLPPPPPGVRAAGSLPPPPRVPPPPPHRAKIPPPPPERKNPPPPPTRRAKELPVLLAPVGGGLESLLPATAI